MAEPSNTANPPTQLDHIILLLSPSDFANLPSWLTSNFTIIPGGTHSKGTSHNKLIIFRDGTYLELFSWTDPQPEGVEPHADFPGWATKPEGCIIDWAVTGPGGEEVAIANHARITRELDLLQQDEGGQGRNPGAKIVYDVPQAGGRTRKDGTKLQWVTTRPKRTDSRAIEMEVPFFCHDVTERRLRVPHRLQAATPGRPGDDEVPSMSPPATPVDVTSHPCGATGIAGIVLEVQPPNLDWCTKLYEAVLGLPHDPSSRRESATHFHIAVPDPLNMSSPPTSTDADTTPATTLIRQTTRHDHERTGTCCVYLQVPDDDNRFSLSIPGTSIRRLVLHTTLSERRGEQLDRDGFGAHINLC